MDKKKRARKGKGQEIVTTPTHKFETETPYRKRINNRFEVEINKHHHHGNPMRKISTRTHSHTQAHRERRGERPLHVKKDERCQPRLEHRWQHDRV